MKPKIKKSDFVAIKGKLISTTEDAHNASYAYGNDPIFEEVVDDLADICEDAMSVKEANSWAKVIRSLIIEYHNIFLRDEPDDGDYEYGE